MPVVASLAEIKQALAGIDLLPLIEAGFAAYSRGEVVVPPVGELVFDDPPGDVHIKYGYIKRDGHYVIKIASGFVDNPRLGLPSGDGLMLVFSQRTGILEAVLLDEGHLTNLRTAVAGAVVAKHLAPAKVAAVGILGAGVQGRMQLEWLRRVRAFDQAIVWGVNEGELAAYRRDMASPGLEIRTTLRAEDVAAAANLIVTCTPSTAPLLRAEWIRPGTHITAMGSDTASKQELDPAILARLSDEVPYAKRGRALAVTELSWSLAFILGVPSVGYLLGRFGGRLPFAVLAGLGLAGLFAVRAFLSGEKSLAASRAAHDPTAAGIPGHRESYKAVLRSPAALTGLAVILGVSMSNEIVNLVFGVWLEDSFGLKIAALGAAAAVIGAAEFGGEGLVVATVDRLGKTRALMLGLAGNTVAALVLPLAGRTTAGALAGLAFFYLTFEYTVVSMLPVMSEILPRVRATLLAFYAASFSIGRAVGSLVSARLYGLGFAAVALAAVGLNAVAFLFLLRLHRLTGGAR